MENYNNLRDYIQKVVGNPKQDFKKVMASLFGGKEQYEALNKFDRFVNRFIVDIGGIYSACYIAGIDTFSTIPLAPIMFYLANDLLLLGENFVHSDKNYPSWIGMLRTRFSFLSEKDISKQVYGNRNPNFDVEKE